MTFGYVMKKSILPMAFLLIWVWLVWQFCQSAGQNELWKQWMIIGFPFGIHRVRVWLVPRNFDIGGTVGVWFVNILVGCIIGGFVAVGYVIRAVYVLVSYLFGKVTKTGCIPE